LLEQLRQVDVERDPIIKQQFDSRLESLKADAVASVPEEHRKAMETALRLPRGEYRKKLLASVTENLESWDAMELAVAIKQIDTVAADRDAQINLLKSKYGELQNWRKENEVNERRKFEGVFDAQLGAMAKDPMMAVLQKVEGNEEHNRAVDQIINMARSQYTGQLPAHELAKNALFAAITPLIVRHAQDLESKVKAFEVKQAKVKAANPGVDEHAPAAAASSEEDGPKPGEDYTAYLARSYQRNVLGR
jgi:hypothetical protein